MILKKFNINSNLSFFSVNASSDVRFLKVGLEETGLVLYFVDNTYGDFSKYYNGVVLKDNNNDVHLSNGMKFIGMEAGCAVFIEDYRDVDVDRIVNAFELRAGSGELDNFTQHLLSFYKESFIEDVVARLESKDLADLQLKLISQAQALEDQLKKKQDVIIQIENLSKELGYQMDFVNKCPAM